MTELKLQVCRLIETIFPRLSDSHEQLGAGLLRFSRLYGRQIDSRMVPFGLSKAAIIPLIHIGRAPHGIDQRTLTGLLDVSGPTVAVTLDRLSKRGFVASLLNPGDRRCRILTLTPKGAEVFVAVEAVLIAYRTDVFKEAHEDDMQATLRLLRHLETNLGTR